MGYNTKVVFGVILVVSLALAFAITLGWANPLPTPTATPATDTLDPACRRWIEENPPAPGSTFGLALSRSSIDLELRVGEIRPAVEITSTGSTGLQLCGYPEPPGGEALYWGIWSAGLRPGSTIAIPITGLRVGEFQGKVLLIDLTSGVSKEIPFKIRVTN